MTRDQILTAATAAGVQPGAERVYKDQYLAPDPQWLTGELATDMIEFWNRNRIPGSEFTFNCVNYAATTAVLAQVMWAKTGQPDAQNYALAIGWAGIVRLQHDVVVAFHWAGQQVVLAAYEPVPRQQRQGGPVSVLFPLQLTVDDWKTCESLVLL